ncbi:MAG: hypothetical protein KHW96_06195, partial [Firmicutes bacterium]|nr:hypothetical protein [Bacillota bacterium]
TGLPPKKEKTVQPRLWGYTVSLPKNILMGLWQKDISSFYACEGAGLRGKQHNAVFRGSVPDTSLSCTYPVKVEGWIYQ